LIVLCGGCGGIAAQRPVNPLANPMSDLVLVPEIGTASCTLHHDETTSTLAGKSAARGDDSMSVRNTTARLPDCGTEVTSGVNRPCSD
jgi:hypothetical protein